MGGALETFRKTQLGKADPLNWHPLNQRMAKDLRNRRERGESPKIERANDRKR